MIKYKLFDYAPVILIKPINHGGSIEIEIDISSNSRKFHKITKYVISHIITGKAKLTCDVENKDEPLLRFLITEILNYSRFH